MKKLFCCLMIGALSVTMLSGCGKTQVADKSVDMSIRRVATESASSQSQMLSQAKSAVVGIKTLFDDGYAIGSGVAISDGGYILTNNHVVEGGKGITLFFADKTTGSGRVVWTSPSIDLAIVLSSKEIPYLGTNDAPIEVGQQVYALGTPLTLEFKHTVTHGIVSANDRTLETETSEGTSFLQSLIQHDAAINPGNSGGPLINTQGQVIGINTLKATEGEGIGFAIPIQIGKTVVDKLKQNPSYKSPYLGVFGFDSDIAKVYGESLETEGVYVVSTDGPAKNSGIQKGDIITSVGSKPITNLLSLRNAVLSFDKNDVVKVEFVRSNKQIETFVTLK